MKPEPINPLAFLRAVLKPDPTSDDQKFVASMVRVRARLAAATDVDESFEVDPLNVGYLKRSIDKMWVYVPFNLVSVFPGRDTLEDMVTTATKVRIQANQAVCLSGSATFLGKSVPISDLDFCEYFPSPVASLPALIAARLGGRLEQLLVRVNWCGKRFTAPFAGLETVLSRLANEPVTFVKLDFLWMVPRFGMMPTTTMILKVEENMTGEALGRSFVHQEAVISASGPPRNLFAASEIAHYLGFLRDEVSKYAASGAGRGSSDSLKAMKRALSLLLLVGADQDDDLHEQLEGLIEDLTGPAIEAIVVEKRLEELSELANDADAMMGQAVEDEISKIKLGFEDIMLESEERDMVLQGTSRAAEGLRALIDDLFSAVGT
jgi:hypothetical protein